MEGAMDCLIDLNSPVPNNQRTSLVPTIFAHQKTIPAHPDYIAPALDNNPFDTVVRLTEINEADKNDPFEIAFEQACCYQDSSNNKLASQRNSVKFTEVLPEKSTEKLPESQPSDDCLSKELGSSDDFNLDDIEPPEFLANSSFELSDNDSININDTLHLSSMSDLKLTPGGTKCSPLIAEYCKADNVPSGESNSPISSKIKSSANSEACKKALSPLNFSLDCLTSSDKSSFEESPMKALCGLKSEDSVKTLIENRIQKCIAKALNDSHRQFRNSILLEPGETSFVANQAKPSAGNLRASLSVPQNLHLLHDNEIYRKPEQSSVATILSPVKPDMFEDLTIPVLDNKTESTRKSFNRSFDIVSDIKPENRSTKTNGIQPKELTAAQRDQKMSHYREIIDAELQKTEQTAARSLEVETESKPKGHRRSLSCDVILPPQSKGSSPPKLPPLPLSSDTIRDLSLCSKYSPPKTQEKSPGSITSKVPNRPVPLPACAQPKLVLRKKSSAASKCGPVTATGSFGGTTKGPMKAVVPVRNMTRFAGGSPRPSAQLQIRRGSIASSRQSSLDSPSYQKSKLCPLAASTPSNLTVQDNAGTVRAPPVITAPSRRTSSSGIPSPSRRGSVSSQNSKPDTPTRRSSVSALGRHANPRVLVDKNGLTSPSMTPIRKPSIQTDVHTQPPKTNSHTLGKENMACL